MITNKKLNNEFERIILLSSLNGGTGKSFIIKHIAKSLLNNNKIGLLDVDINNLGLTQSLQLLNKRLESTTDSHGNTLVQPFDLDDIKFVSAGLLDIGSDLTGLRGGALSGISRLLINEINWGKLDYLLIDLPSGLSDIELTILDDFPAAEVLLISNGNIFADNRKLQYYFNRNIKILGLFYNRLHSHDNFENNCIDFCKNNDIKYFGIYTRECVWFECVLPI